MLEAILVGAVRGGTGARRLGAAEILTLTAEGALIDITIIAA